MTITKITSEPYNVFEAFQFMNVMILEQDGTEREISIVEPLISEVLKANLAFRSKPRKIQKHESRDL